VNGGRGVSPQRPAVSVGTIVAAALALTLLPAGPAAAACDDPILSPTGQIIGCLDDRDDGAPGGPGGGTGGGSGVSWTPPPGWELVEYREPAYEDDGTPCIRILTEWMPPDRAAEYRTLMGYAWFRWYDRITADGTAMEACTTDPGTPALDPAMVRQMIESQLPLPQPSIDPGRAITGLRSYLDVGAPTTFDDSISGDVLPVTVAIDASAQYRVDWGDGTVETYSSSGGPYPDGDITHVHTSSGSYTVTVTPVWTVSWEGGGQSFTFTAELVPSTVDLPVGEVQSVRTD
jgi:hypothetical protein